MSAMARALAMPAIVPVSATVPVGAQRERGAVLLGGGDARHHPSHPTADPAAVPRWYPPPP